MYVYTYISVCTCTCIILTVVCTCILLFSYDSDVIPNHQKPLTVLRDSLAFGRYILTSALHMIQQVVHCSMQYTRCGVVY